MATRRRPGVPEPAHLLGDEEPTGPIGVGLADHVLVKLSPPEKVAFHPVGHSFGGRMVTATANRWRPAGNLKLFSLPLLQAAYSHNGLVKVVTRGVRHLSAVSPTSSSPSPTRTHNDVAVTHYYAKKPMWFADARGAIS